MAKEANDKNGAEQTTSDQPEYVVGGALPKFKLPRMRTSLDWASVIGLLAALGLIVVAIVIGQSDATFFNGPALLIVFFGTIAATSISYTGEELARAGHVIGSSLVQYKIQPQKLAHSLIDLAVISHRKNLLTLSDYYNDMSPQPFLRRAIELAVDDMPAAHIDHILSNEIEAFKDRHRRSASITRRAAEVAPAMGLIGTLVGLVQMLADLQNPETIGPSMAVALLTTFYGAILGTIIMGPLAVKLDKQSADEVLNKTLIKTAAVAIANKENPRRLEVLLNSELPPSQQIKYFD